jgi:membrane protein implicated in regulation of membrane protease activity
MAAITPFWLFLIVGCALLATELLVFQFTTFWLFFVGLGALCAAVFAWLAGGAGFISTTAVFVIASALITALLYTPIRRWQSAPTTISDNNAIGQRVVVSERIQPGVAGLVSWSGTDWQAELASGQSGDLNTGDTARVVAIEGIRLIVAADSNQG